MNFFTDEEDAYLARAQIEGVTIGDMSIHLGRTENSVAKRILRIRANRAKSLAETTATLKSIADERREAVRKMTIDGLTPTQIAASLKIGQTAVKMFLRGMRDAGVLPYTYRSKVVAFTGYKSREMLRAEARKVKAPWSTTHHRVVSPKAVPDVSRITKSMIGKAEGGVPRVTLPGVEPYEPLTNVSASRTCMRLEPGHDVYPDLLYCGKPSVDGKSFCTEHHFIFYRQPRPRAPVFV